MMDGDKMRHMAKDLQTLLASFAGGVPVYEREAPRNADGAISVEPPFAVYTADTRAPENEGGEWSVDLTIDVWSLGSWARCYDVAEALDDALDSRAYTMESGTFCADRNGLVFERMERDQDDERIRRMQGQYLLRFNPNMYE